MAKRSRESFQKRAREKARQEKQADKREKRQSSTPYEGNAGKPDEAALMEEFASLSALLAANQMTTDEFNDERDRIFGELGLETD